MKRSQLKALIKEIIKEVRYNQTQVHFETLGQALDEVDKMMEMNQIVLDPSDHPEGIHGINEPFSTGGISYEQTKDGHFKIATIKGKPTRKALHVSIYRMPSGRYELTQYVS